MRPCSSGTYQPRPSLRAAVVSGALAGFAVVTEYPTAVAALVLLIALAVQRPSWRVLLAFCVGGLLGALPGLIYHQVAFGAPWATGYGFKDYAKHAAIHAQGLFGITVPTPERLWGVLFSARRGTVSYCPLLLLVPVGYVLMVGRRRPQTWPLIALTVVYTGVAAGFVDWEGGWCAAARHLVPALPLLIFPVAEALDAMQRWLWSRVAAVVLVGMSLSNAVLTVAVTPFFPEDATFPLAQIALRSLLDGAVTPNLYSDAFGLSRPVALGLVAVLAVTLVVVALLGLFPGRRGRLWIPLLVPVVVVLWAGLNWAVAPAPERRQEATRAVILHRLGYPDLAQELWQDATRGLRPPPGQRR